MTTDLFGDYFEQVQILTYVKLSYSVEVLIHSKLLLEDV